MPACIQYARVDMNLIHGILRLQLVGARRAHLASLHTTGTQHNKTLNPSKRAVRMRGLYLLCITEDARKIVHG